MGRVNLLSNFLFSNFPIKSAMIGNRLPLLSGCRFPPVSNDRFQKAFQLDFKWNFLIFITLSVIQNLAFGYSSYQSIWISYNKKTSKVSRANRSNPHQKAISGMSETPRNGKHFLAKIKCFFSNLAVCSGFITPKQRRRIAILCLYPK